MKETKFKQTDIGLIPEDWMVENLGSLGSFCKGRGISRADANSGNIPAVRYGELYTMHDYYIKEFGSFISPQIAMESRRLKKGDIVFTCSGETKEDIGKSAAFVDDVEAYAGGDLIILSPYSQYNSLYLGFATNSKSCQEQKASKGQGDAVVHISAENIKTIQLAFPPTKEEQERIADALSQMDNLIAALDEQIEKKRLIKQGAMQQLLTGKIHLKGFTGEWKTVKLGQLLDVEKGQQVNGGELNDFTGFPMMNGGAALSGYYTDYNCEANNIIISEGGNSCGFVNYMKERFWAGGHCYIVSLVQKDVVLYMYNLLKYNESRIMALRVGSGLPNIQRRDLLDYDVLYCCDASEQQAIASTLSTMDDEIQTLQEERDKYVLVKQGMMQQLLTGKIRLN
jgi:type I restriction enzyme S subunit